MPVNPFDIASFFVKKGVSPLKLQKLLYYSQVWHFVTTGNYLIQSNDIRAWIYGPIVPSVWDKFRYIRRTDLIPSTKLNDYDTPDQYLDLLDQVWNSYGHLSGSQLVDLTHSELPWIKSRVGLLGNQPSDRSVIINKHTTADFQLQNGKVPIVIAKFSQGSYSNFYS